MGVAAAPQHAKPPAGWLLKVPHAAALGMHQSLMHKLSRQALPGLSCTVNTPAGHPVRSCICSCDTTRSKVSGRAAMVAGVRGVIDCCKCSVCCVHMR